MISQYYMKRQYKNADAYLDSNLFYFYRHNYNVIYSDLDEELWDVTMEGVNNPSTAFDIKEPLNRLEMMSMHALIESELNTFISAERWG